MVTEEYFPRGKTKTDTEEAKPSAKEQRENRFVNILSEKDNKQTKKKKTKDTKKKQPLLTVKSVPTLGYEQMKEGLVVGGVVSEIADYEVKVSLPCHLVATLPITNISSTYTEALRKAADDVTDEEVDDDIPSLSQIFKIGQFIVVAVVTCEQTGNKYNLTVSVDPKLVMAGRVPGQGDLCVASVISKEDHGYLMDVGNRTVRGFLPNKTAQKHWNKNLSVGMVILCIIVKKEKGAVTLKCDPGKVFNTVNKEPNLHNSLPGTLFKAKVVADVVNGVKVEIGTDVEGFLHADLFPVDSPNDLEVGAAINVRLVNILPTVNTVLVTGRPIWPFSDPFEDLKSGTLFKEAVITQVQRRQLILKLSEAVVGCVTTRNAKDGTEIIKNLKEEYKVGSKVKARVLGLDYFSRMAMCTMKKSLVSGISSLDQLTIGQKLTGTVKRFVEKGLEVSVGTNLTGFIPILFLSDVPLKHPEKKYLQGDKIECRVLNIVPEKKRLHLTSKPILVKKEFSVVANFDDAEVGTITEGVVTKITKDGLLLSLFGEMRGFAPRRVLSSEPIEFPEKLFFIGQAVKCQIIGSEKDRNRVTLSLVIDDMKPLGRKEKERGSKALKLGKIYSGKVTNVSDTGVDLEVVEDDIACRCVIPTNHLTDNFSLGQVLIRAYKVGDVVQGVCIHHDVVTVLSKKKTLLDWAKSEQVPETFENIHEGSLLPGFVHSIKRYGIFLKIPIWTGQNTVLVPSRNIANFYVDDSRQIVEKGQTLMVKINERDEEKTQLAGTTNFKDLVKTGTECVSLMKEILEDFRFLRTQSTDLGKFGIGDLRTATIKETTEMGLILDVNGTVGLAPKSTLGGTEAEPGNCIPVLVVFVDYQAGVLEVSCDPNIITSIALCNSPPEVGSSVRGKIIMTRTEHNIQLVSITHPVKHAGCLVFVPSAAHINDFAGDKAETSEKPITLIIQHVSEEGEIIGMNEKQHRMSVKKMKRERSHSTSKDDVNKIKRQRTESESSVTELLATVKSQEIPDFVAPKPPASAASAKVSTPEKKLQSTKAVEKDSDEKNSGKEKSAKPTTKKEKGKIKKQTTEIQPMEICNKDSEKDDVNQDKGEDKFRAQETLEDPGWDFSLTRVTLPSWNKASIWDDSDEEMTAEETGTKKHLSKKEAKLLRKEEESAAEEAERKVIQGENQAPQSEQEFEKLVLSSPDSSLVWIQFMAFYLQSCQYNEAREVAKRAVERINFREEGERLNVFLAWLNLENTFGNQDTLDKVLRDALQRNDEFKVYSQMADIYTKSSKLDDAEKIYKILAKKFRKDKEVWIRYGLFYYKNSRIEEGRFVFTRSLQNLEPKDCVDISAKFAQIEFRYGDTERGKTMYEKLVTSHPKRVDLWSSYVDQLTRIGDIPATRVMYNRISTLGLQARKMKALFGKWLEFEKVHGTEDQQSEVKRAALQYLNARDISTPMEA